MIGYKKFLFVLFILLSINIGLAKDIKVAAIQLTAKQQSLSHLQETITKYATNAKKEGANIVVFPEDDMLNLVYDKPWDKSSLIELASYYNNLKAFVSNLSKKLDIYLIAGSTAQVKDDSKLYNTALIGVPSGYVIEHDKIYLTPGERKVGYDGSGNEILILETEYGKIAILICYTSEFANISYILGQTQPDLIIVPSYTDDIYGLNRIQTSIKMLAIQNYAYGLAVGMVSNKDRNDLKGAASVAQTLFSSPQQQGFPIGDIAMGRFNYEQMLIENLDLSKLHSKRKVFTAYPNKDANSIKKNLTIKTVKFR